MEPFRLTFGIPNMSNRGFQFASYNDDSSIGATLMTIGSDGDASLAGSFHADNDINASRNISSGGSIFSYSDISASGDIYANGYMGVVLDQKNYPLITRGYDKFSSGYYSGSGRWGLFMEPHRLTFGIPDIGGKGFQFSTYNDDSSINPPLMTIMQDGNVNIKGKLTRNEVTGNTNLIPFAMGCVNSYGDILSGSGNFTVTWYNSEYRIHIDNFTANANNHIIIASPFSAVPFYCAFNYNGDLIVAFDGGSKLSFYFVVYQMN
jgi:hypothetical protein